jgi:hypothetical protein
MVCSLLIVKGASDMATPQPQQPQQPIYQRDLNYALDRVHNRFVEYANAKDEALASQMRVGFTDSYNRDEALRVRVERVEATQQVIIDTLQLLRQEVRAGFAALDEKYNELNVRMLKLEGREPPTEPE